MVGIISIENINYNIPFDWNILLFIDNDDLEAGNNEDQDDIATETLSAVKTVFAQSEKEEEEESVMVVTPAEEADVTDDDNEYTEALLTTETVYGDLNLVTRVRDTVLVFTQTLSSGVC